MHFKANWIQWVELFIVIGCQLICTSWEKVYKIFIGFMIDLILIKNTLNFPQWYPMEELGAPLEEDEMVVVIHSLRSGKVLCPSTWKQLVDTGDMTGFVQFHIQRNDLKPLHKLHRNQHFSFFLNTNSRFEYDISY